MKSKKTDARSLWIRVGQGDKNREAIPQGVQQNKPPLVKPEANIK